MWSFTLYCASFFRNTWCFPSLLPPPYSFDPALFSFHISLPSSFIFFFPPCSLFRLALSFSRAFISTSYGITVRLGEYNEAVPPRLQTYPVPVCQASKTNLWQIFWHSDTREEVCNDSKHSDTSSTITRKKSSSEEKPFKNILLSKWERERNQVLMWFPFSHF